MKFYPLKFSPILKSKIWGGSRLEQQLGKETNGLKDVGESWEISSVPGDVSIIANGALQGMDLSDAIEKYQGQLVGNKVYEKFGNSLPLLLKFIDANEYLSIQVHPDDTLAAKRHDSFGKTEMWYIVSADADSELIVGFNQSVDKEKYMDALNNGRIKEILNVEKVEQGDVFYLPAGRVHATGSGILFAEIQQTSDLTYRIYDWDRVDDKGKGRELHTEQALDAMDFGPVDSYKTDYERASNKVNEMVQSNYFTTNYLNLNKSIKRDYSAIDSFVAYMFLDGEAQIAYGTNKMEVKKGESILIPATIKELTITPKQGDIKMLEVYLP